MIALITPTGFRRQQIELCNKWMRRQTYTGEVLWLIIDDANPVTTEKVGLNFPDNWTIEKIYPKPAWKPGWNTQGRNISEGVNRLPEDIEAIFIIEDDDYYKPQYLERMMFHLGDNLAIGETHTIYYNVFWRRYFVNPNVTHVSLFQLCFRPELLPVFRSCYNEQFIDFIFYQRLYERGFKKQIGFFREGNLAVGIKGMPGRGGIGAGHKRMAGFIQDVNLRYLKSIIGDNVKEYERYYGISNNVRKPLFVKQGIRKR